MGARRLRASCAGNRGRMNSSPDPIFFFFEFGFGCSHRCVVLSSLFLNLKSHARLNPHSPEVQDLRRDPTVGLKEADAR